MSVVQVAVPVPLLPTLTYRVPPGLVDPVVGARVRVPLGSRVVTGCVIAVEPEKVADGAAGAELKAIVDTVDEGAFLPRAVLEIALWISEYYAAGPGDAIAAAMPPQAWAQRGPRQGRLNAFKTERVARITDAGRQTLGDDTHRLGSRQRAALAWLAEAPGGMTTRTLATKQIATDTIRRLSGRGYLQLEERRVERDPFEPVESDSGTDRETSIVLTPDQERALGELLALVERGEFHVGLLHGVTGSGKTELYVRLARAVCDRGLQALILVPEIVLAPAVAETLRAVFGDRVAIQHSGLSDGERHDQWHRIRQGNVDVVVGTRSAVFAPLAKLGLVVVDEEHDTSYKQEESPRYHGRDAAIMRGRQSGAVVVLGSATPSMESHHNAMSGRYVRVVLPQRILERPLPAVRVVDMRDELAARGSDVVLSSVLLEGLESRLSRREQSLVLLNRRGYAAAVLCRQCGQTLECPNCSITLTFHRAAGRMRCHYCNYSRPRPSVCPNCAGPYLERLGFGTERIEAEITKALPEARVARLDRDAVRRRGVAAERLKRFGAGDIDVLVGTQMIAKGHDFPSVTLVGVVSADVGLGIADFRAAERTFQLLTQVAGRAGRGERPGEAVIQTLHPDHYSIGFAVRQAYEPFFEAEMRFRRNMRYPPVVAMVNAIVRAGRFGDAMRQAGELAGDLRDHADRFEVLGPAPAPISRLRGEHRAQIFLKGRHRPAMREALQAALARHPQLQRRVTVDIDPLTVL